MPNGKSTKLDASALVSRSSRAFARRPIRNFPPLSTVGAEACPAVSWQAAFSATQIVDPVPRARPDARPRFRLDRDEIGEAPARPYASLALLRPLRQHVADIVVDGIGLGVRRRPLDEHLEFKSPHAQQITLTDRPFRLDTLAVEKRARLTVKIEESNFAIADADFAVMGTDHAAWTSAFGNRQQFRLRIVISKWRLPIRRSLHLFPLICLERLSVLLSSFDLPFTSSGGPPHAATFHASLTGPFAGRRATETAHRALASIAGQIIAVAERVSYFEAVS